MSDYLKEYRDSLSRGWQDAGYVRADEGDGIPLSYLWAQIPPPVASGTHFHVGADGSIWRRVSKGRKPDLDCPLFEREIPCEGTE